METVGTEGDPLPTLGMVPFFFRNVTGGERPGLLTLFVFLCSPVELNFISQSGWGGTRSLADFSLVSVPRACRLCPLAGQTPGFPPGLQGLSVHSRFWAGRCIRLIFSGSSLEGGIFLKDRIRGALPLCSCPWPAEVHRLECGAVHAQLAGGRLSLGMMNWLHWLNGAESALRALTPLSTPLLLG